MVPSPSAAEPPVPGRPAAPSRLHRLGEWMRPALVVGLLTFSAGVVCGNVLPTRAELAATRHRLEQERADNERLKRRIVSLTNDVRRLESDPWATERILRDELRMSADDEVIVH